MRAVRERCMWVLAGVILLGASILFAQSPESPQAPDQQQSPAPSGQHAASITKQKTKHVKTEDPRSNWYSIEAEIKIGKARAQQIEQSMSIVDDPAVNEYVDRIGQNLVRNSGATIPFVIRVVDSNDTNVIALPGGFLYVPMGLIRASDSEAELAGVIAHGVAHVTARHATRMMTRQAIAQVIDMPLIRTGSDAGCGDCSTGIGLPLMFLKFVRAFEAEADFLGIQYSYNAGYNPDAFVSFLEKLEKQEKARNESMAITFAATPPAAERIRSAKKEISKELPARDRSILTTPEFEQIKTRLIGTANKS